MSKFFRLLLLIIVKNTKIFRKRLYLMYPSPLSDADSAKNIYENGKRCGRKDVYGRMK
jgi:hypothetical protein